MKKIIADNERVYLRREPINEVNSFIKELDENEKIDEYDFKSIIMVENEKVGYLTLTNQFNNVYKINMSLIKENKGLGIGTRTMNHLMDISKKWNSYLITEIAKEDELGNRLFQRKGQLLNQNRRNNLYILGNKTKKEDFVAEGYLERYLQNNTSKCLKKVK